MNIKQSNNNKIFNNSENIIIALILCLSTFFILLFVFYKWPDYWILINDENTPMTWYQSTLLFSNFLISILSGLLFYILNEKRNFITWFFIAAGFLFLTMDEKFQFHERVREGLFKPNEISTGFLPWVGKGDFILLLYLFIAIIIFIFLIKKIIKYKKAFYIYIIAGAIGAVSIIVDSFDFHKMSRNTLRIEQFFEEIGEAVCFTLILCANIVLLLRIIKRIHSSSGEKKQ